MKPLWIVLLAIAAFAIIVYFVVRHDSLDNPTISRKDIGIIQGADAIPTTFNEVPKMKITTSTGVYFIWQLHSVSMGEKAEVAIKKDGRQFLCVESLPECWAVIR